MSLLDDARRLDGPINVECDYCMGSPFSGHFEGCPITAVPRIIAALETVRAVAQSFLRGSFLDDDGRPTVWSCTLCGHSAPRQDDTAHTSRCRIGHLTAALRGEVPA